MKDEEDKRREEMERRNGEKKWTDEVMERTNGEKKWRYQVSLRSPDPS